MPIWEALLRELFSAELGKWRDSQAWKRTGRKRKGGQSAGECLLRRIESLQIQSSGNGKSIINSSTLESCYWLALASWSGIC